MNIHERRLQLRQLAPSLCAAYQAGASIRAIGKQFKVGYASVQRALARAGIPMRTKAEYPAQQISAARRQATSDRHSGASNVNYIDLPTDEMIALYQQGQSARQIARHYGINASTVIERMRGAGIEIRASRWSHRTEPPINEIRALYESGVTLVRIGHMYGIGKKPIGDRLKAAGVTLRSPGYSHHRRAKDGHMVASHFEEVIDDWLFDHGLAHEIQPPCPWVVKVHRNQRADFRIGNVYIELWGMIGNQRYDAKRDAKLIKYRECGAELIQLFPHHILNHDYSPLERLLS